MPILVHVIQPEHTFICRDEGDEELSNLHLEINTIKREGGFVRFKLEHGQAALINADNIGMIRYISKEEMEENIKQAEKKRREQAQSNIIRPNMMIPRGRGRSQ